MARLSREPLLHFLVAGAALFAVHGWLRGSEARLAPERPSVQVSKPAVEWLARAWARQWQRPPDAQELRGLVADYVKEQILANEARALGLADDDTVVRRRLAQKMEFLLGDTAPLADPEEGELRAVYEANRPRFEEAARISFAHVFFKESADGEERARRALTRLASERGAIDPASLGDPSLFERELAGADEAGVASLFGAGFAKRVFAVEPGRWSGPIVSAYGVHLVRVTEKEPVRTKAFDEVRDDVVEEWRRGREQAERQRTFASLLEKYDIVVDDEVGELLGPLKLALASASER